MWPSKANMWRLTLESSPTGSCTVLLKSVREFRILTMIKLSNYSSIDKLSKTNMTPRLIEEGLARQGELASIDTSLMRPSRHPIKSSLDKLNPRSVPLNTILLK